MAKKVVLNKYYGGFELSEKALNLYNKLAGTNYDDSYSLEDAFDDIKDFRANEILVKVVETLGADVASGDLAKLKIVEIPDTAYFEIDEYDGFESLVWSESEIHYE